MKIMYLMVMVKVRYFFVLNWYIEVGMRYEIIFEVLRVLIRFYLYVVKLLFWSLNLKDKLLLNWK